MNVFIRFRLRAWGLRLKGAAVNGALLAAAILISFGLLEVGLRTFNPVDLRIKGDKIVLYPLTRQVMDGSAWPKFDKEIIQSHNALGLRGPNPPQDLDGALSVITLGGSTTECYYLSDGKTWPDRLGAELKTWFPRAWVNNAGMDGQSTFGHIKLFEQHIADLHPKVVLIMAGVNDQAKSREGLYDGNVRPAGPPPANLSGRVTHWLSRHSETYALGFVIVRSLAAQKTGVGHGNLNFAAMGEVTVPGDVAEKVLSAHRPYIPAYGERLVRLAEMIRAHGALPVFVTQAAMWGEGTDPTTGRSIGLWGSAVEPLPDGKTATINAATSWHILELYNEETRQIGARFGVPVVDLGREMAKDSKFFYDWYHMANEGAAEAGRLIARDLCPILKSAFPGQANSSACPG